nr:DUF3817 domain-containing protein [Hymenobacter sp. 15J16-1T3B]
MRQLGRPEGPSLLVGVAVPLKPLVPDPTLVPTFGPVHGLLFLLFVLNTLRVVMELGWRFADTSWQVLMACLVPFGTFYIDRYILPPLQAASAP